MRIDVLGSVRARRADGTPVELGGPRHREVLARLVAADGRLVPTATLVDDLWAEDPPPRAVGALRTFVGALRRALEPDRPPRTPPRLLVTEGPGYALRLPRADVDAHRFEDALARARHDPAAAPDLTAALADWRGPAYADLPDRPWARRERDRLEELRLDGIELRARLLLDTPPDAGQEARLSSLAAELGAHVDEHPWREAAWALLARALHRSGRQADALAALRRARTLLGERLGLDPGAELQRLEADILTGTAPHGQPPAAWSLPGGRLGPRTTVDLARTLSLAGGDALLHARRDRLAAVHAAERTGDPLLTARVIAAYDVPALWSRADDAAQSRAVVEAAERTLAALGPDAPDPLTARLLATVAVESRTADQTPDRLRRAGRAARRAETLARQLGDPALLAFALNGVFLQSFDRPGLAPERDRTGAEILDLATRHDLPHFAVLGRLVRLQSASALGDLETAAEHARAAERLAATTEAPLVGVLTTWFRARAAAEHSTRPGGPTAAEAAARYRHADTALRTAGMPGLRRGLLPLALLGLRLLHERPAPVDPRLDWGPHLPWARPHLLLAQGRRTEAAEALTALPDPPPDHLQEALWCLTAHAAARLADPATATRAAEALHPARTEHAGAASGLLTLGPVARYLAEARSCAGS